MLTAFIVYEVAVTLGAIVGGTILYLNAMRDRRKYWGLSDDIALVAILWFVLALLGLFIAQPFLASEAEDQQKASIESIVTHELGVTDYVDYGELLENHTYTLPDGRVLVATDPETVFIATPTHVEN